MKVGQMVRVGPDGALDYPMDQLPAGMLGIVVESGPDKLRIFMLEHVNQLSDWDNCVEIYGYEHAGTIEELFNAWFYEVTP